MMYFFVAETVFQTELANREENLGALPDTFYTSLTHYHTLIDKGKLL